MTREGRRRFFIHHSSFPKVLVGDGTPLVGIYLRSSTPLGGIYPRRHTPLGGIYPRTPFVILSGAKDQNISTIGGQILHFVQDDKGEGVGK